MPGTTSSPTAPGRVLARSAAIFDGLRAEWVGRLGAERVRDIEDGLHAVVPSGT